MTSWHDIQSLTKLLNNDFKGKNESLKLISSIIDDEITSHSISADRILLAGFSQGGAMSIFTGLQYPKKLAGIISLSGYLCDFSMEKLIHEQNKKTPIFLFHAEHDNVVRKEFGMINVQGHVHSFMLVFFLFALFWVSGEKTSEYLKKVGCTVTWKTYNIFYHGCDEEEMRDMITEIGKLLPNDKKQDTKSTEKKQNLLCLNVCLLVQNQFSSKKIKQLHGLHVTLKKFQKKLFYACFMIDLRTYFL
ncbi:acyl-protein thioesterase [Reticulomyxa filosa]|uniref:Acyl-protein thioesterase n=1 Tax=Reticulomyxa filosa TaxID=46433 RepID=X6M1K6_RETFI|nr:acyl-protein thioesterase [Reticulomyxa filosa]|eukprot:ETO07297.1 acyl-protein thioesterase [Reticulomyxa filosa]